MVLSGLLVGCSNAKTYQFEIEVKNETDHPITLWLAKQGLPVEKQWQSPEQIALVTAGHEERIHGKVVQPGQTAYTGVVSGRFEPDAVPWLRIYDGEYESFSDLLAASAGSKRRVDHALDPGKNHLTVLQTNGRMVVRTEQPK